MRRLWHTPWRFLLIATTVVPIYLGYLRIFLKKKWFGRGTPAEKWSKLHRKNAKKFYRLACRMKGGLIKVGQIISTRVDVVPKEWAEELSALQDKVDPTPWKVIAKHIERELGAPADEVFEHIDHEAVAAASFGQVHRATTKEGEDVALKVRYADIEMKLRCDLFVLRCAVPLFNFFVPKVKLKVIYEEIGKALTTELDYRQEAEYTRMIHANLEGVDHVVTPEVVEKYTTESVICTTFFEGYKITDKARLEEDGIAPHDVIKKIIDAYTHMFFIDGVFQSDPHPGNLLMRKGEDGEPLICILDFGQVKVLPRDFQRQLIHTSIAFMGRDVDGFARNVVKMGVASEKDLEVAKPLLREFFDEMFEMSPAELKQLDAEELKEKIQDVANRIDGVHIPQDIILYGRAFGLLAGVIAALDEEVNGIVLAKPAIMAALMRPENFTPVEDQTPEPAPAMAMA